MVPIPQFSAKVGTCANVICEQYLGNEMMRVFERLEAKNWPNPITKLRENPGANPFRAAFKQWPGMFDMDYYTTVEQDFLKMVDFLETNCFWQENMFAKATDFWTHLLSRWVEMPDNLKKLVEKTLSVPYGSADAERAFKVMNSIKTTDRTLLKLQVLDALMRIAMHDDTVEIFNPEPPTQLYAQTHLLCD